MARSPPTAPSQPMMWCFSGMSISTQKQPYNVPPGALKPPGTTSLVRILMTSTASSAVGAVPMPLHAATSSGGTMIGFTSTGGGIAGAGAAPMPAGGRAGLFPAGVKGGGVMTGAAAMLPAVAETPLVTPHAHNE